MPPYIPSLTSWRSAPAASTSTSTSSDPPHHHNILDHLHPHHTHSTPNDNHLPHHTTSNGGPPVHHDMALVPTTTLNELIAVATPQLLAARQRAPADLMLNRVAESDNLRDLLLARYLRAAGLDQQKALHKLNRTIQWRSEHLLESIPYSIVGGPGVRMPLAVPSGLGLGYHGEQLMYVAPRHTVKPFDYAALEKAIGVLFDHALYKTQPQGGCGATSIFVVIDLFGVSISQVDLNSIRVGIPIYLNHYAGVFSRICVLNYTYTMHALWKCVAPLLDQDTRDRISFVTGEELKNQLKQTFPSSAVPVWLGGEGVLTSDPTRVLLENGSAVETSCLLSRLG